jgi:drug/metabolite transporter superfamily protein YnfA
MTGRSIALFAAAALAEIAGAAVCLVGVGLIIYAPH